MRALALTLAAVAAAGEAAAAEAPIPPAPTRWAEDHAGFLSPAARATLDARLEAYERQTGHQVVVWIGHTIGDTPLDDWAVRTFAAWKIGRKGLDDGIAIFILADDRAIDIEVGYGLEGQVPDVTASRVIREVMAPRIKAGDRDGGVTAGVDALLAAIEGRAWTAPAVPPAGAQGERKPPSPGQIIFGAIVLLAIVIFAVTHPRLALFLLWSVFSGGRGGGGFGGGGGGFRGGGGRSGGGGARGHW